MKNRMLAMGVLAVTLLAAVACVPDPPPVTTPPDTTPPVLALPDDLSVVATSPAGATVMWSTSATDAVDGAVPVSCTPQSGSVLPIGTTQVSCSAEDAAENRAEGTFDVTVRVTYLEHVGGESFRCVLTSVGGVRCSGSNVDGQLGNGTTTFSNALVDVVGLGSGVTDIAAGGRHACAVVGGGALKCWGLNDFGQLGDGTLVNRSTPVDVVGVTGVTGIATNVDATCVVTAAAGVDCWGQDFNGVLGNGPTAGDSTVPGPVVGVSDATDVELGFSHGCALTSSGAVKCWGYNSNGELGSGAISNPQQSPVGVVGLSDAVDLSANGGFTCARTSSGAARCWGSNDRGQLGDGTTTRREVPTDVTGLASGVTDISAGGYHACATTDTGAVSCWGWNQYGQVGDGTTTTATTPVGATGLTSGVVRLGLGTYSSCGIDTAGSARCWGRVGSSSTLLPTPLPAP